jgi:hypothetical protein
MREINQLKLLPKVEVSFQDDFSGSMREYTLTPKYILNEMRKAALEPKIGDEILLWEKDMDGEDKEYYLCNIGKIVEAKESSVSPEDAAQIGNESILIEIDRDGYFDLPIDSPVFR